MVNSSPQDTFKGKVRKSVIQLWSICDAHCVWMHLIQIECEFAGFALLMCF